MFKRHIELAVVKAASPEESAALHDMIVVAGQLDEQERTFGERIDASKAARGEGPTPLSGAKRREVDRYADDAEELDDDLFEQFSAGNSAWLIVFSLHMALERDVEFWSKNAAKGHPGEAHIVQEWLQAKISLRDALAVHLSLFPDTSDDEGWSSVR